MINFEQDVLDMVELFFGQPVKPETTIRDLGLDSLEVMQVRLLLEDRFGSEVMRDYEIKEETSMRDMAEEAERRVNA